MTSPGPGPAAAVDTPTDTWSDDLLLIAMSEATRGPAQKSAADVALRIFHDRWEAKVDRQVELMCRFPPANAVGIDMVIGEVWRRVYRSAGTFCDQGLTGERLESLTFGWLKRIAINALLTLQAQHDSLKLCAIPDEGIAAPQPIPIQLVGGDPRLAAVADCLRDLTSRESDVLRTSAHFLDNQGDVKAMDPIRQQELCTRYGTKAATIRQIRRRAMAKLKACVEPKLQAIDQGD